MGEGVELDGLGDSAPARSAVQALSADTPLDTTISIETPEHVQLKYELAGPSRRALAYLVDGLARGAIVGVFAIILALSGGSGFRTGVTLILVFLLEWGYFVICELTMAGRSPGKRALELRVVTLDGSPISFGDSVLRNLLRAADFLPSLYVFGALSMLFDSRFRRLGDLAAGTMVVYERRQRLRPAIRIEPPPTERELRRFPERVVLASDVVLALEHFLRKAHELSELRADEVADLLARPYAARLGVRYKDPMRFVQLLYCVAVQGAKHAR